MAFEQTVKNLDNCLRTDKGCTSELDYVEQTSWILFLKYLDDLEKSRQLACELQDIPYAPIIAEGYRWNDWAMPKGKNGEYDTANALVGDDLIEFVDGKLFPYLKKFKEVGTPKSIEVKIGVIFSEIRNRIQSGYNLRDILEQVDGLRFQTSEERHEMTYWYESRLNRMGNAGRNGGEYYTPRPLIRTIVKVVDPKIGKTVYDGACGSAGFLCEAYNYMHDKVTKTEDEKILQEDTFTGKDDKALPYIIATMNMILHGVECPNIINTNTLTENLADVQEKDRFDFILANPPFGGKERAEVQQNFTIKTSETAYLFLEHFIKYLRAGGQAGIVIKNTFLSNTDNASIALRKKLLEECNLHTILDLPSGVFQAGVTTAVLFFKKGEPTRKVWFYQLNLNRTLGKTDPLNEKDLEEFVELQKTKADGDNSWTVSVADLNENYDLSPKNPNKVEEVDGRTFEQIKKELATTVEKGQEMKNFLDFTASANGDMVKLKDVCTIGGGYTPKPSFLFKEGQIPYFKVSDMNRDGNEREMRSTELFLKDAKKTYPKGTVVFPKNGGAVATNKKRILAQRSVVDLNTGVALPNEKINPDYLYYYFSGINFRKHIKEGTLPVLRTKEIEELPIYLPSVSEQSDIVAYLDKEFEKISELRSNAEKIISLCDDLKHALLKKVFDGEL